MVEAYAAPSPTPPTPMAEPPPLQLLVLAMGPTGGPGGPEAFLPPVAARLAALLGLPVRSLDNGDDPPLAMAQLSGCHEAWLAALPVDPGLALDSGGHWAETLGAWRQPCLLVLESGQMTTGMPAAGAALLQQWQVPLVGLIQWGGPWDSDARRRDGLPWLGCLDDQQSQVVKPSQELPGTERSDPELEEDALGVRLRWRWAQLDRLAVA